jgi:hypothetical protein
MGHRGEMKGGTMISEKLVSLIKDNAKLLTNRLIEDLYTREETRNYRKLDKHTLYQRVFDVYNRLDAWLLGNKVKGEVRNHYIALGRQRFQEGIPLEETLMALMLIKRHLWLFVNENNFLDNSFMLNQALGFNNSVVLFFDRAIYFTTIGYIDEMLKPKDDTQKSFLSKIPLKKQDENESVGGVKGDSQQGPSDRRPLT